MHNWQKIKNNPHLINQFLVREKVIDAIREYFKSEHFHEVETPLLVKSPGTEPYLEVFETTLKIQNHDDRKGYLLTSPELAMKKLLSAGLGSIFQVTKSFRNNEGISSFHNPEFTILEWYRINADYCDSMNDCERLLVAISTACNKDIENFNYQGKKYSLSPPWERISISEAFEKYASINVDELLSEPLLLRKASEKGYVVNQDSTWEELYNQILLNEIEPHLGVNSPTILYDYPASQAALSKKKVSDPRFSERFEFYLAGFELGNAFSELIDWEEQQNRMILELSQRKALGKTEYAMDEDFILALKSGMPESSGVAVGVDRLVALFADVGSISDVLFFPATEMFL